MLDYLYNVCPTLLVVLKCLKCRLTTECAKAGLDPIKKSLRKFSLVFNNSDWLLKIFNQSESVENERSINLR